MECFYRTVPSTILAIEVNLLNIKPNVCLKPNKVKKNCSKSCLYRKNLPDFKI